MSTSPHAGKIIKILTEDKVTFEVPFDVIRHCNTLVEMLDDLGSDGVLTIAVKAEPFQKVIDLCTYRVDHPLLEPIPKPEIPDHDPEPKYDPTQPPRMAPKRVEPPPKKPPAPVDPWITAYVDVSDEMIFSCAEAANYLNHEEMLYIFINKIAAIADAVTDTGISHEENIVLLRQRFNIEDDLSVKETDDAETKKQKEAFLKEIEDKMAWCKEPASAFEKQIARRAEKEKAALEKIAQEKAAT